MTRLAIEGLSVERDGRRALDGASLEVGPGELVGLLGPNGAGKTTLLRAALGLEPAAGRSSLAELPPDARARAAAYLPQSREIAWPIPVEALVALGRAARRAPGARENAEDREAVGRALARLDLGPLRRRPATALSGGEQARVLLARALAQETPLLLADEPTAGLDPAARIGAMRLLRELAAEGRGVLVALHDLGDAARCCTRVAVMERGRIVADAPPAEALTPARLAETFGVSAWFAETPLGPVLQPMEALR